MMPEADQIRQFDSTGDTPVAWILSAQSLLAGARLLRVHRDSFDRRRLKVGDPVPDEGKILFPELMLTGFAIECLLKALWLKCGNQVAVGGQYTGVRGAADHDLVQLADAAGMRVTGGARHLLKRLSIILSSSGRYPVPRQWSARRIQKLPGGGKGNPEFWSFPSDDRVVESIITTLQRKLAR